MKMWLSQSAFKELEKRIGSGLVIMGIFLKLILFTKVGVMADPTDRKIVS